MANEQNNKDTALINCKDGKYIVAVQEHKIKKVIAEYSNKAVVKVVLSIFILLVLGIICYLGTFKLVNFFKSKASVDVEITIKGIEEKSILEVLSVYDSVIITDTGKYEKKGVSAWTEYVGKGVYVVDLQKSEFIVDNQRKLIIIKTPAVTIDKDNFTLDYQQQSTKFFYDKGLNGSIKEGVDLAQMQLSQAYAKIFDKLYTNANYYSMAEKAAKTMLENLAKSFNKEIEGLQVIVEIGAV